MKKTIFLVFLICIMALPAYSLGKKQKAMLYLAQSPAQLASSEQNKENFDWVFKTNQRIYFEIVNPNGFKSDYIKYQIIKQDNNAHMGGYTRIRNITVKVKSKKSYSDYFVLSEKGKYYIQVFDIVNLQQWLAIGSFLVVE